MFEQGYYGYQLDYAQLPLNFDRYSSADKARIAARMWQSWRRQKNGVDLETGPFPMLDLTLEDALARIEMLVS